ncbi:MAG TPA: hypothetical protein VFE47_20905 [Tepidisphaeraceae bacterium]|nr:hypothetical protein [Tepidisphaeraceae bacterium]
MRSIIDSRTSRRDFLSRTLEGSFALGGGLAFLSALPSVSADEAKISPSLVKLDDGIEPTVRLLEETPRERVLEEVAGRIRNKALSYREVLTALLLAGVRNVQPRPQVGFKFHAVLVVNSAHLASLASGNSDRWLPIFWAIDRFKASQLETQKESGWRMGAVDESKVPTSEKARQAFIDAMEHWDEAAADTAAAGLARFCGRNECFELFARFGARDFRDIGHKAIFVSNSFRLLECVGWHNAEPVLRSLAYALLQHEGGNPAQGDAAPDRPWRRNVELVKKIKPAWQDGKASERAAADLLSTLRTASDQQACETVVDALNGGLSPQSVWDALLSGSCELLMRKTGIVSLHSVTSSNALHFAHNVSAENETRLMLLLQNAAFVPLFRQAAGIADKPGAVRVDQFEAAAHPAADAKDALADIFASAGKDRISAAKKALAYLDGGQSADDLMHAARRLVFLKGNDAHDYKFSSAVLEDYRQLSPKIRNRYLAAAMFYFPGTSTPDNALTARTRAAIGA